ncbi:hypothetical protein B0H14DRAFT_2584083 [Mycena olivaceomarginata]|nr:hypothetical protein B0H14DRAFT_2584083 [Mycena olivaceomarginata]
MPRGRPPLDPDIKQQHCEEALKRYSDKQKCRQAPGGRTLRMQRKRNEERAERRAADAVRRQSRGIEKDALDRKDARPKKVLQAKPLALPPLAKPPHTVVPPRAISRITPTPAPRRAAVIRMPAVAVAVANDDS